MKKMHSNSSLNTQLQNEDVLDIDQHLKNNAQQWPMQIALADSNQQLTWQQLDKRLNKIANTFIELGIQPNQRIAILGRNSVDYATLFLGGLRAGICISPLSTLSSGEALAGMINDSEAQLLFVSTDYLELIQPHIDLLTGLMTNGIKILEAKS